MLLTETKVKVAKFDEPGESNMRPDGDGLFLHIEKRKNGDVVKSWLMRVYYRPHEDAKLKEVRFSLGQWPTVSLEDARADRAAALQRAKEYKHPNPRKQEKATLFLGSGENTLEALVNAWLEVKQKEWTAKYYKGTFSKFKTHIFPYIGDWHFDKVTADSISLCVKRILDRGTIETARRTLDFCCEVYDFAIAHDEINHNPAERAKGRKLIPVRPPKHYAAILDVNTFCQFLRDIYGYEGYFSVQMALRLAPLVFVRSGELRQAKWKDIDFDKKLWTFDKSKIRATERTSFDKLTVPLSRQAIAILKQMHPLTGKREYVFEGRFKGRPLSDNTFNPAFRRMGYSSGDVVFHGFRATARTLLVEELNFDPSLVERQLSHTSPEKLKRAYDRTLFLDKRTEMMQRWADYLDDLRLVGQASRQPISPVPARPLKIVSTKNFSGHYRWKFKSQSADGGHTPNPSNWR